MSVQDHCESFTPQTTAHGMSAQRVTLRIGDDNVIDRATGPAETVFGFSSLDLIGLKLTELFHMLDSLAIGNALALCRSGDRMPKLRPRVRTNGGSYQKVLMQGYRYKSVSDGSAILIDVV